MMAMETTMARGTTSTFSPTATSWEEMWRNFSPISSLNFSSPKMSVNDVSVFSTSMILFLCCSLEWQKWTQAIFYFDLGTYGIAGWWNEGPETWPSCHLDSWLSESRKLHPIRNEQGQKWEISLPARSKRQQFHLVITLCQSKSSWDISVVISYCYIQV